MSFDTTAVSERSLDFDNASPKIGFPKNFLKKWSDFAMNFKRSNKYLPFLLINTWITNPLL